MKLRTKVNDCEFDKMGDDKAIKSVITLHTQVSKKISKSVKSLFSVG